MVSVARWKLGRSSLRAFSGGLPCRSEASRANPDGSGICGSSVEGGLGRPALDAMVESQCCVGDVSVARAPALYAGGRFGEWIVCRADFERAGASYLPRIAAASRRFFLAAKASVRRLAP